MDNIIGDLGICYDTTVVLRFDNHALILNNGAMNDYLFYVCIICEGSGSRVLSSEKNS